MKPDQLNRLIRANSRMQPWFLRNTTELYESAVRTYYERSSAAIPYSAREFCWIFANFYFFHLISFGSCRIIFLSGSIMNRIPVRVSVCPLLVMFLVITWSYLEKYMLSLKFLGLVLYFSSLKSL